MRILRTSTILNFKPVTFPEPSLLMLVLGGEGSSWDEMGLRSENVKAQTRTENSFLF